MVVEFPSNQYLMSNILLSSLLLTILNMLSNSYPTTPAWNTYVFSLLSQKNKTTQSTSSMNITKTSARTLDTNSFGRYHITIYLNTYLNPKLYFPFILSSLTSNQYTTINKDHILSELSSMRFNKIWILFLRYSCHAYGGLQLKKSQSSHQENSRYSVYLIETKYRCIP